MKRKSDRFNIPFQQTSGIYYDILMELRKRYLMTNTKTAVFSLFVYCLGSFARADGVAVTNQPPPHAGWEASQDVPLPPRQAEMRVFTTEISFTATASNNVQVAFGSDADKDAKLPAEETSATIGWDRGEWFILSGDLLQKFTCIPQDASTATNRTLRMSVRLSSDGTPIGLSFKDGNGNALAFAGLEGIPSWISPKLWDTAALTARGWDARDEQAAFSFVLDGTHIILR